MERRVHRFAQVACAFIPAFLGSRAAPCQEFAFGYLDPPYELVGTPGEKFTFEVFLTLTPMGAPRALGASEWFVVPRVDGAKIVAIRSQGEFRGLCRKGDALEECTFGLDEAVFCVSRIVEDVACPGDSVAFSRAIFAGIGPLEAICLLPEGTQTIAALEIEATFPERNYTNVLLSFDSLCDKYGTAPRSWVVSGWDECPEPMLQGATITLWAALPPNYFLRGDVSGDGRVGLTDAVLLLRHLFLGEGEVDCLDAADTNDDDRITVGDPVRILAQEFLGTYAIPRPGPGRCGSHPGSVLGCAEQPPGCRAIEY